MRNRGALHPGFASVRYTGRMRLLLGTSNAGKILEMRNALTDLPLTCVSLEEAGITASPEEHGQTYAENALLKARYYAANTGLPAVADDSGIMIDALAGELGTHTRRWGAGPDASDAEWASYFLRRMEREENRSARFLCTIAFIDQAANEHLFEGVCQGQITRALEAPIIPGLPLSSCFKPDGYSVVYSAMKPEQKNSTSHRGRALYLLRSHLARMLGAA